LEEFWDASMTARRKRGVARTDVERSMPVEFDAQRDVNRHGPRPRRRGSDEVAQDLSASL